MSTTRSACNPYPGMGSNLKSLDSVRMASPDSPPTMGTITPTKTDTVYSSKRLAVFSGRAPSVLRDPLVQSESQEP